MTNNLGSKYLHAMYPKLKQIQVSRHQITSGDADHKICEHAGVIKNGKL